MGGLAETVTQASDWLVEQNRLHKHPYAEILIIRAGAGTITIGDRQITATAGQIIVVPANAPHKFSNLGPGAFESIDIHESGEFIMDWLE